MIALHGPVPAVKAGLDARSIAYVEVDDMVPHVEISNALGVTYIVADDLDEVLANLHGPTIDGACACKTGHTARVLDDANAEPVLAPVCPECRDGKHRNCDGIALDEPADELVPCACPPAFHPGAAS